jgi:hypothetical protein
MGPSVENADVLLRLRPRRRPGNGMRAGEPSPSAPKIQGKIAIGSLSWLSEACK